MYQRQDVQYVIDQYESQKYMRDHMDKKSRDFLQEYFQEGDNSQFFEEHKIK
jgi:ribonuclease HIII